MRVLYVITGLSTGGAEMMLLKLVQQLDRARYEPMVISLRDKGAIGPHIEALGVPVYGLGLSSSVSLLNGRALKSLFTLTASFRPDIIQGWMYHGNLAAAFAWRMAASRARLYWGIRQSLYDLAREKVGTRWVIRFSAWASHWPTGIIYNSHTARAQHEAFGFARTKSLVIDNGFDVETFRPDPQARLEVRQMLGLLPNTPLIGLIARYHPMKGHEVFLKAAALLAQELRDVHFLLVGREVLPDNPALSSAFQQRALTGRVHCLGERHDIARLTAALDIASSSSSWGEAFPNAIGEAMSCGVPCVATNVGDVPRIIGETGIVVPAGNPAALADAWARLLHAPAQVRRAMGEAARRRVLENFSIDYVAARYAALYRGADEPEN